MRIGYSPYSASLSEPGDRRRFLCYAAIKGLDFDVVKDVSNRHDVVILSSKADIVAWSSLPLRRPEACLRAYRLAVSAAKRRLKSGTF